MNPTKRLPKVRVAAAFFTLALSVGFLAGCGSSSDTPPSDGSVGALNFDGDPGHFSGRYDGTCVVQSDNGSRRNCSTHVSIQQDDYLKVQIQIVMTPSAHNRNANNKDKSVQTTTDRLRIKGKTLMGDQNELRGTLGTEGFGYHRAGSDFSFRRTRPLYYVYSGTFTDVSGRAVTVTGEVKHWK